MNGLSRLLARLVISVGLLGATAAAASAEELKSAVILDSRAYGPGELFDLYHTFLGKPVRDDTAARIAAALREKYSTDGYARPGYAVEDGGLDSGIVRIRLREARISRVEISGDPGPFREKLEGLFSGFQSAGSLRPADVRDAIRRARRLRGLGLDVSTVSDPGESGAFVMQVRASYDRMEGRIKLSNRGTQEIGRNLAFGTLSVNGVFGSDSTAGLSLGSAEHSQNYLSAAAFLNAAAGANGTILQLVGSAASLQFDSSGTPIDQDRERFLLKLVQPLPLEFGRDLSAWIGLDIDNLDVAQDDQATRADSLRSVVTGIKTSWRGAAGVHLLTLEADLGVNGLGSALNDFTDPDDAREKNFAIATMHYVHLQQFADAWTWRWDAYGQHSPHILPSIKQFKVGGNRIGRGFEAAAVSGDRGIGNKLEVKRRLGIGPSSFRLADVYTFYDLGSAWRNSGASGRESAASAGIGLNFAGDALSAYIEVAKPLTHDDVDGKRSASVFAEISATF